MCEGMRAEVDESFGAGFREAVFGPDAPAVVVGATGLAIIGVPLGVADRLAKELSTALGKQVAAAEINLQKHVYTWVVTTAGQQIRRWTMVGGATVGNAGVPGAEEAGIAALDAASLLTMVQRAAGASLGGSEVAIPINFGPFAVLLETPGWRETTPRFVRDDFDVLLSFALKQATQLLEQSGTILPSALAMGIDGQVVQQAPYDTAVDGPTLLSYLTQRLHAERDHLRAIVVTMESTTADGANVIGALLEHREGSALQVLLPYAKSRFRGRYTYGEPTFDTAESRIWA